MRQELDSVLSESVALCDENKKNTDENKKLINDAKKKDNKIKNLETENSENKKDLETLRNKVASLEK